MAKLHIRYFPVQEVDGVPLDVSRVDPDRRAVGETFTKFHDVAVLLVLSRPLSACRQIATR